MVALPIMSGAGKSQHQIKFVPQFEVLRIRTALKWVLSVRRKGGVGIHPTPWSGYEMTNVGQFHYSHISQEMYSAVFYCTPKPRPSRSPSLSIVSLLSHFASGITLRHLSAKSFADPTNSTKYS